MNAGHFFASGHARRRRISEVATTSSRAFSSRYASISGSRFHSPFRAASTNPAARSTGAW
jgi:hypothetical protein